MASVVLKLKLTWSYGWTSNQSASIQWIRLMPEMLGNLPKLDRFFFSSPAHIYFFFFFFLSAFQSLPLLSIFSLTVSSTVSYKKVFVCVCVCARTPCTANKAIANVLNTARAHCRYSQKFDSIHFRVAPLLQLMKALN